MLEDLSTKRVVYDTIHGHLELENYLWKFIDTEEFQRLRNLKQLGNAHFVFPGGNHTRFEHSLGTSHLSSLLVKSENISTEFKPSVLEKTSVALAGLLHDLGHGPYSHLFDRLVIKQLQERKNLSSQEHWEHENGSAMLLEYLIDNNNIDKTKEEISLIQNLILGEVNQSYENKWIFQIVANKHNSIDVDKFDYISRDTYHLGLEGINVDFYRIFGNSKVIDNELCFSTKNEGDIDELFRSRYRLFKQVYYHKTCYAIDLMIKDCLLFADPVYNFLDIIKKPEEYLKLDDNIIHLIEHSNNPLLKNSQEIVQRLYTRDLYTCILEILIPNNRYLEFTSQITIENIISNRDSPYLLAEDIEVVHLPIDYGNKDKNPFESKMRINSKLDKQDNNYKKVFKEYYLRVYIKHKDKVFEASKAVNNLFKRLHILYKGQEDIIRILDIYEKNKFCQNKRLYVDNVKYDSVGSSNIVNVYENTSDKVESNELIEGNKGSKVSNYSLRNQATNSKKNKHI